MLIDGIRTVGTGESFEIVDPATGQPIETVAMASSDDVHRAVAAAERAFAGWRATPPAARASMLLTLADEIAHRKEELAAIESRNTGKPLHLVLQDEIPAVLDCIRFYAGAVRTLGGPACGEYVLGHTSMSRREPIGVVAQIVPWNYPLMMAAWKLAPALAAGNTVVLKPAEWTPLSVLALEDMLSRTFPPGVVNVVLGRGATVGQALAEHSRVRMIALTGSTQSGKAVAAAAARNLKRTHLELGGKAPVIVFGDADIESAVAGVRYAGFYNAGQDCTAACRVYVQSEIYQDFSAELARTVRTLRCGAPADAQTEMGPLISASHRQRVQGFVRRAMESGHAKVLTGGSAVAGAGFYFEPTVIAGVRQGDEIVQEEVFGPIVTLTPFSLEEEVLAWANDTEYALASSIWTRDAARAMRLMTRIEAGVTWVNTHFTYTAEMPHGGAKQSGYGSDLSTFGLDDYTQPRHVMWRH